MAATIFERNGGFATMRRVVSAFYDRVLDSEIIGSRFEHVDMPRLIDHQTRFITSITGGPGAISDDQLRRVHAPLHISHDEFTEMARLLRETLEDFDWEPDDVTHVYGEIARRESLIVSPR
jgi:hemoglobin